MKAQSSIEKVNIDQALDVFDNNQFQLILAASVRAREIASQRVFQERNGVKMLYESKPAVEALVDVASGKVGKEYLNKIR
jgi:DNA-directed RNA polymerase omega subunit